MENILDNVGKTPFVKLDIAACSNINLYVKLEYTNPTGSVKDRAASHLIQNLLEEKIINANTTLIESSSGNFGISLAAYCKKYQLNFICVIDPNTNPVNEAIIKHLNACVVKVTEPDSSGGYLLSRIQKVNQLAAEMNNAYWVNQYANPLNANAYYHTLGKEISDSLEDVDYLFLGVSSGGTITGTSRRIKECFPKAKVIAVDIKGSVIFGGAPSKRSIPGIGSSMVPQILKEADIDDVILVDELSTIQNCHELLQQNYIFAGGSSGSVIAAIKQYFEGKEFSKAPNVVTIFADRGDRYSSTIYNENWCENFRLNFKNEKLLIST